ncbi:alpha/beta fold hydrolase [Mycolicibacterium peregrinum]
MTLPQLPPGRTVEVRAVDGVRLHAEVFGPEDGYPIVLAHGITCAIGVWAHQIADLATDYRVIAYDHRGHGHSETPRGRNRYSLNHLAADLDAVLDATLRPGERAIVAGHSMGGIAITSWSQRYPGRVPARADAVALINTTTGDLVRDVKLLRVPIRWHRRGSGRRVRRSGPSAVRGCRESSSVPTSVSSPVWRWAVTPTRRSPNSSISCSPRLRPPDAVAGPARW